MDTNNKKLQLFSTFFFGPEQFIHCRRLLFYSAEYGQTAKRAVKEVFALRHNSAVVQQEFLMTKLGISVN